MLRLNICYKIITFIQFDFYESTEIWIQHPLTLLQLLSIGIHAIKCYFLIVFIEVIRLIIVFVLHFEINCRKLCRAVYPYKLPEKIR